MIYEEYGPSPALAPFVDRLWALEGAVETAGVDPILPDGHGEIIVHAGDPFVHIAADGRAERQEPTLISGQLTRAIQVAASGEVRVVGARFQPGGLHALLGLPQHELTDRVTPLTGVHTRLARIIAHDVCSRQDRHDLVAALDRALCAIAPGRPERSPADAAAALALGRHGLVRVGDLAAQAGIGPRQLERLFRERVGVSPKLFLRIVRFQEVLGALRTGAAPAGWAEVAATHGYYDQAHFVHDFKAFTGTTPAAWQVGDDSLTAVFSAIRRHSRPRQGTLGIR
jgi:AraC-like DNA-binding protein